MTRIILAAVLWTVVILVSLALGSSPYSPADVWTIITTPESHLAPDLITRRIILLDIRLPRILLAGAVGAALSLAGTALQGLFRNPLASPYVLGISAGAALGAVISMVGGFQFSTPYLRSVPLLALIGASVSTLLVYSLARVKGRVPIATLLLAGVALGSFLTAVVSLVLAFSNKLVAGLLFWLLGGFSGASWSDLGLVLPFLALGLAMLVFHSRDLNAVLLGEETSQNLGIDVERVKRRLLFCSAMLTGAAVSVSGNIGFVGLIVPHIARQIVGPDHRVLIPVSALAGAILLTSMDTIARTALAPDEIPVGVISALLGGPFFIFLLRRHRVVMH